MQLTTAVLHLEDSDLDAELIRDRLMRSGLPLLVVRACDRVEFVAKLTELQFGLILVDYQVPGFEGLAAMELAREYQPEVPVLFVSGKLGEEVAIETLKRGATDYVLKERLTRLVPAVKRALAEARERAERRRAQELLRRQNERLRLLWETAALLLSAENPEIVVRGLFDRIGRQLDLDTYFNYAVTESGDALRLVSYAGVDPESIPTIERLPLHPSPRDTVPRPGRSPAKLSRQQFDDPCHLVVKALGLRTHLCIPLLTGNRLLGTLSFGSRTRNRFDDDEVEFLETVSHYVAIASERFRFIGQLREDDRRKDEFLATLAHELRNPLAPIRNALEVMKLSREQQDREESLRMMDRHLTHMVRLIDDLLDISRVTRGKLELRKEYVDLALIVRLAVETARPHLEGADHDFQVVLPTKAIYLHADPVRLGQVLANLLNNAAKYTERGGRIRLTASREGDEAVISVQDNGIGIPADVLPRVFEMFMQAERARERSQGGLGVGLTLVSRLVELHGGNVEARSGGPGQGSEFLVRLPISAGDPSDQKFVEQGMVVSPRRILVVDDNRDGADSLAMMLRLLGNKVETAYDGFQAFEAAETFRPDVVLLDIGLPGPNGLEVARQLRAQSWGKKMILFAVTGWGQEEDRRKSLEAGFDHHLVKPVDPSDLEKLLAGIPSRTGGPGIRET